MVDTDLRTPHRISFFLRDSASPPNKLRYACVTMRGKADALNAVMISRFGYASGDKIRVILYHAEMGSVPPVRAGDYFVLGEIKASDREKGIGDLKTRYDLYRVQSVTAKTGSIPYLHHTEIVGG